MIMTLIMMKMMMIMTMIMTVIYGDDADFHFVNGRCHLRRSMPQLVVLGIRLRASVKEKV